MLKKTRWSYVLVTMGAVVFQYAARDAHGGELQQHSLRHDERTRRFAVYVPDGYTAETAWPLVINMHGATSNRAQQMSISRMNLVADAEDFLVAYPNAVGGFWNDALSPSRPDDIGFIGAMIDELSANLDIDPSRVYATGFSQGGAMSYLLANALPERIAAIASVSGSPGIRDNDGPFPVDLTQAPTSSRAVPILYFVGTADRIQFAGGRIPPVNGIVLPPFSDVMEAWAVNNGCELESATTEFPDLVKGDGPTTVTRNEFVACDTYRTTSGDDAVAEVSYFLIQDGGHTWPGGGAGGEGNRNRDINASEEIWSFFSRHSLPAPSPDITSALRAGDADQDLDFDQLDLVQVQIAGKYLTGEAATWAEGDWNGAPAGHPGSPPSGDGLFNQLDVVAAQQAATYLTGPYAAIQPDGQRGDGQTSLIYDANSGKLSVDAPARLDLTSINVDSAASIFTGQAAENLGGSFDNDADGNIFKATFGSSFGSLSFGHVAQPGLSEEFVLGDLTVVGSLAGGGDLGSVDLVYVPEPMSAALLALGLVIALLLRFGRSRR